VSVGSTPATVRVDRVGVLAIGCRRAGDVMILTMGATGDGTPAQGDDELRDLYERYIAAFNARDEAAFAGFFHLPVTVLRLPVDAVDPTGAAPTVVTEMAHLWPVLPPTWTRSTIDDVRVVADAAAFTPRPGFADRTPRRAVLQVTVTRWAGDEPYEQVHVLYVLTREDGRLGIKAMVPLAVARPPV
jgi:hypothetical protein